MAAKTGHYSVLIVDDEEIIRTLLLRYLGKKGYAVHSAEDGEEGLRIASEIKPDLVIADIRMPRMNGFELLQHVDRILPSTKRILMTGYNIDTYIEMIRQHNIGNILTKGSEFSLDELGACVASLLSEDIFGLEKYFGRDRIFFSPVRTNQEGERVCAQIIQGSGIKDAIFMEIAINELISNAVFHGALKMTNVPREQWREDFQLSREEAVIVSWAKDEEKIGVSVEDPNGNLHKVDVLRWLDHRIDEPVTETEHGRGFMLVRKLIDRFIVNIDPGKKTECILLQYLEKKIAEQHKPLLVREL